MHLEIQLHAHNYSPMTLKQHDKCYGATASLQINYHCSDKQMWEDDASTAALLFESTLVLVPLLYKDEPQLWCFSVNRSAQP